jgi:hypothetical protein
MNRRKLRCRAGFLASCLFLLNFLGPVLLSSAALAAGERLPSGEYVCAFEFKPEGSAQRVSVAGDFNNWSADATPLKRDEDGVWRGTVAMSEGIHHYKFVIDGNKWVPDPKADASLNEGDNYGGVNSGVFAGPDGRKLPPAQPNAIHDPALAHDRTDLRDQNVVSKNLIRFPRLPPSTALTGSAR